ncbi:MAG: hypothetical protein ABIT01_08275 [Thermoanaerobaculia bacterium]
MLAAEVSAIDDLILGRGVRRGRHELDDDAFELFRSRLQQHGFQLTTVGEVAIEIGVRVPAWYLRKPIVDFGMIFWEVFTPRAKRKLFASDLRNEKGDWDIQLYPTSTETLYVNRDQPESYDASRPIGFIGS